MPKASHPISSADPNDAPRRPVLPGDEVEPATRVLAQPDAALRKPPPRTIVIRCPHPRCGKPSSIAVEFRGRAIRCPHCRQPFTLPAEASAPSLASPVDAIQGQPTTPPAPSSDLPAAVGRFQVRARLGQGAFGAVYRAYDPQLDREVALKVPLPGTLDTPERVKRFLREARAAAGLRHPHIVPVFDAGGEPPLCYIASAFIEGRTLASAVRDGPMDLRRAARLVRELAEALAYAHRQGIVHRDVKPGNVMLDANDETHLMDFGLAHRREGAEKLTQDGALLGTPAFMAPERVAEPAQEPESASDQYSLGVLMYELLTGRIPFDGPPDVVLFNTLHTEPPSPRTHRRDLPRDLETICLKAMAKWPRDRYATCEALADDLRRWLEGEPIRARRTSLVARTVKWAKRRPAQAVAVTFIVVCLGLGVGYFLMAASLRETEALRKLADQNAAGEVSLRQAADAAAATELQLRKEADVARDNARTNEQKAKAEHDRAEAALCLQRVSHAYFEWKDHRVPHAVLLLDQCPPALRRWEWNYVHRLCHAETLTWRGSAGGVCFSPDGQWIADAGLDNTVRLWNAVTGKPERSFRGHTATINTVCFSPDSKLLASGGEDKNVKVWLVATGNEERTLAGHSELVNCVCFSPDGKRLASGGEDKTIRLWDVASGKEECALRGHTEEVSAVCFSPDGKRLASASYDLTVRLWDAVTGKEERSLDDHDDWINGVCFSPDGQRLASASDDGTVIVWDVASGKKGLSLKGHDDGVSAVCFSPDGRRLASGSEDGTVRLWDAATGKLDRLISGANERVLGVSFSPDGRHLAAACDKDTVRVWDLQADQEAHSLPGHKGSVEQLCFSPDGRRLASCGADMEVKLWDMATGKEERTLRGHSKGVGGVCFSPDGQRLASASDDKTVKLWDAVTGKEERTLTAFTGGGRCVSFSPDGKHLAGGGDGTVKVWDLATWQWKRTPSNGGVLFSVCFSPDCQHLASGDGNGAVRIWNVATAKEERNLPTRDIGMDYCVRFSPDGKWLVSAGNAAKIQVWDAATGQEVRTFSGHVGEVSAVCFSPDSHRLASAGSDGTVKVWDMATGQEALSLKGHVGGVNAVCFSPDGRFLASAGDDGRILLWDSGAR